jgi:hypothetical protein
MKIPPLHILNQKIKIKNKDAILTIDYIKHIFILYLEIFQHFFLIKFIENIFT